MSFEIKTLRDFVRLQRGTTYKGSLLGLPGPVLLGLASIQANGGFRRGAFKTYGGDSPEKITLKPGEIYVSLKDVTQSGDLLGSVARVPSDIQAGRLTQDTVKLDFHGAPISHSYIYWLLRTPLYREYCRSRGTGTTTLGLGRDDFLDFPVTVPTNIELSLVELLEALDDRIALLRETNATLEAIAQALFKSWFVDFDPVHAKMQGREPAGMDEATAALFPSEFEESELGLVPKGWRVGKLGDITDSARKQIKPDELNSDIHYVGLEHIPRQSLSLMNWGSAEGLESAKASFNAGDILFGKLRPYFHKVVIAPFDGVCSTDILVCRPKLSQFYSFVTMQLFSETLVAYATRLSNGAKMPRINWKDISDYPTIIPSIDIAAAYDQAVRITFEKIVANVHKAQTLATLRDTLLPRLISGQLRLPDVADEVESAPECASA